jgi:hypothetical protein
VDECKPLAAGLALAGNLQDPRGQLAGGCEAGDAQAAAAQGRVVQVVPIKPKLKPPRNKRLKLICDILLSTSAFKFKLRRYNKETKLLQTIDRLKIAANHGRAVQVVPIKPRVESALGLSA